MIFKICSQQQPMKPHRHLQLGKSKKVVTQLMKFDLKHIIVFVARFTTRNPPSQYPSQNSHSAKIPDVLLRLAMADHFKKIYQILHTQQFTPSLVFFSSKNMYYLISTYKKTFEKKRTTVKDKFIHIVFSEIWCPLQ